MDLAAFTLQETSPVQKRASGIEVNRAHAQTAFAKPIVACHRFAAISSRMSLHLLIRSPQQPRLILSRALRMAASLLAFTLLNWLVVPLFSFCHVELLASKRRIPDLSNRIHDQIAEPLRMRTQNIDRVSAAPRHLNGTFVLELF